jgi:hypothetical protein
MSLKDEIVFIVPRFTLTPKNFSEYNGSYKADFKPVLPVAALRARLKDRDFQKGHFTVEELLAELEGL